MTLDRLNSLNSHDKLDSMLRNVHIYSNVYISWDDSGASVRKEASKWAGAGNIDLYMVFHWLKQRKGGTQPGVKKVIEVLVEDGAKPDGPFDSLDRPKHKPHSDKVIVECLKGLDVESLDWRRLDIPTDVIVDAAGKSVKTLYLHCSGLRAVLQGWANTRGLVRLKEVRLCSTIFPSPVANRRQLERVHVEIIQGLESFERIQEYGKQFKLELELTLKLARESDPEEQNRKRPPLLVRLNPVRRNKTVLTESSASKLKSENEQGFEE